MLIIDYVPHRLTESGNIVAFMPDSEVEPWVKETSREYVQGKSTRKTPDYTVHIGQELILTCFRVIHKEQKLIPSSELQIRYNGVIIPIDDFGRLSDWPKGFCDYNDDFLNRILEWT